MVPYRTVQQIKEHEPYTITGVTRTTLGFITTQKPFRDQAESEAWGMVTVYGAPDPLLRQRFVNGVLGLGL